MISQVAGFAPVGLDELVETAALLARADRKYALTPSQAAAVVAGLPSGTRALEIGGRRDFGYDTTYLDTPDLAAFRMTAYRRRRRFKVRTRTYTDSDQHFLEVKTRERGSLTIKDRLEQDVFLPLCGGSRPGRQALGDAAAWVGRTLAGHGVTGVDVLSLAPTLRVGYRRSTLLLPDGARLTLDSGLEWETPSGARVAAPGLVLLETKTTGRPCAADKALWRAHHRPDRVSKYATGLACLVPGLPDNRWKRTLTRYFKDGGRS
jgi:hypothetical protein